MTDPVYLVGEMCGYAALFLPAALLVLRWRSPRRMPWWLFAVIVVLGVWALVWLSGEIYYDHAGQLLNDFESKGGKPTRAMIENATSDAGQGINAVVGFMWGPVLSLPWLVIYAVARFIAGRVGRPKQIRSLARDGWPDGPG